MFDIHKYIAMMKDGYNDDNINEMPIKLIESEDGELIISIPLNTSKRRKLPQYYCFSTERHTGSFFLKIGAAVFCLGTIVHLLVQFSTLLYTDSIKTPGKIWIWESFVVCQIKNPVLTFPDDLPCPPGKETVKIAMGDILQSLFVILQLFMIFKYSNVIVNRSKRLAKVAFMHCIVSSLCFWLNGIINETRQSLVNHAINHHSGELLIMK